MGDDLGGTLKKVAWILAFVKYPLFYWGFAIDTLLVDEVRF